MANLSMSNTRKRTREADFYEIRGTGEIVRGNVCVCVCVNAKILHIEASCVRVCVFVRMFLCLEKYLIFNS